MYVLNFEFPQTQELNIDNILCFILSNQPTNKPSALLFYFDSMYWIVSYNEDNYWMVTENTGCNCKIKD